MTQVYTQQVSLEATLYYRCIVRCVSDLHGLTEGVTSVLQGGKFGHGFLSAGFAKAVTTYLPFDKLGLDGIGDKYDGWEYVAGRTTVAAISGGTASVIGGGKFENGAKTAALAHLLNGETRRVQLRASAAGRDFIKNWEGFRSSPYKVLDQNGNPTGRWTVGYGHEITDTEYQSGRFNNISRAQAAKLLANDLAVAEASVHRFVANNNASISLSQNQFDALVSLAFNSGYIGRFPNLSSNFASGNHAGVAAEFLDITNGGIPGLANRRRAEYDLYLNGNYSGRP